MQQKVKHFIHVHNETLLRIYNRYLREGMVHKQIFPEQKFTLWDFVKMFTGNVVADYYYAWCDRKLQGNLLSIPLFRLMQFWGTYRGFVRSGPVTDRLKERFYYPNSLRRPQIETAKDFGEERRVDYAKLEKENPDCQRILIFQCQCIRICPSGRGALGCRLAV